MRRTRSCCTWYDSKLLPQVFLVHGHAIGDRPAGQVVVEPVHVPARVGHPLVQAERLGDVSDPFLIDAEGDRVGQERLGGEQLDLEPGRHAERPDRSLSLVDAGAMRVVGLTAWAVRLRLFVAGSGAVRCGIVDRCQCELPAAAHEWPNTRRSTSGIFRGATRRMSVLFVRIRWFTLMQGS